MFLELPSYAEKLKQKNYEKIFKEIKLRFIYLQHMDIGFWMGGIVLAMESHTPESNSRISIIPNHKDT